MRFLLKASLPIEEFNARLKDGTAFNSQALP